MARGISRITATLLQLIIQATLMSREQASDQLAIMIMPQSSTVRMASDNGSLGTMDLGMTLMEGMPLRWMAQAMSM
jgi:hypothetical protein